MEISVLVAPFGQPLLSITFHAALPISNIKTVVIVCFAALPLGLLLLIVLWYSFVKAKISNTNGSESFWLKLQAGVAGPINWRHVWLKLKVSGNVIVHLLLDAAPQMSPKVQVQHQIATLTFRQIDFTFLKDLFKTTDRKRRREKSSSILPET